MLFVLVPISLLLVGLAAAGKIIYRKIPRDLESWNAHLAQEDFGPTFYQKHWAVLVQESKKFFINTSTKTVHRLKIVTLKTDNFFGKLLQEMRHHRQRIHQDAAVKSAEAELRAPVLRQPDALGSALSDQDNIVPKTSLTAERTIRLADGKSIGVTGPAGVIQSKPLSDFAAREQQYINQLAYNPKDVAVYKKLGWLYLENTQPFQARQAFKMAVKLGSKDKNVITKLLEMGGVVHKEGPAAEIELLSSEGDNVSVSKKPVFVSAKSSKVRRIKVDKGR
mgnify:FL=1